MLFTPFMSWSQNKKVCICDNGCITAAIVSAVTKGYYAIGNNAEKLAKCSNCCSNNKSNVDSEKQEVNKGYYAIGNNRKQLQQGARNASSIQLRPKVQKGYYAIGNNNAKLQKEQAATGSAHQCTCN